MARSAGPDEETGCLNPLNEEKIRQRLKLRARILALTVTERANASEKIRQRLEQQPLWKSAQAILFYAPLPDEPDIWALFEDSLAAGKRVFLPRFHEATGHYCAGEIKKAAEDLTAGRFGIREPKPDCAEISLKQLDLILVPGLGFTIDGRRLGRGKGYYDRLLGEASCVICGVAFDEQIADTLPLEAHDRKMDCLVTPTRWQQMTQNNAQRNNLK